MVNAFDCTGLTRELSFQRKLPVIQNNKTVKDTQDNFTGQLTVSFMKNCRISHTLGCTQCKHKNRSTRT